MPVLATGLAGVSRLWPDGMWAKFVSLGDRWLGAELAHSTASSVDGGDCTGYDLAKSGGGRLRGVRSSHLIRLVNPWLLPSVIRRRFDEDWRRGGRWICKRLKSDCQGLGGGDRDAVVLMVCRRWSSSSHRAAVVRRSAERDELEDAGGTDAVLGCGPRMGFSVWKWAYSGPSGWAIYVVGLFYFVSCFVVSVVLISPYRFSVGVGACTLCALSALVWLRISCLSTWLQPRSSGNMSTLGMQRVPCVVKWSLPPSGRVKLSVVGFILWRQHSRKAMLMEIMLRNSRVNFLLCHHYVKANRAAIRALFASRCLVEYMFVEAADISSGLCNQGFRLNVPPLYSTVSLIKA